MSEVRYTIEYIEINTKRKEGSMIVPAYLIDQDDIVEYILTKLGLYNTTTWIDLEIDP